MDVTLGTCSPTQFTITGMHSSHQAEAQHQAARWQLQLVGWLW